ncbi:MAG TPA: ATP-binding cassette domain-containing protein [candidate division Zixibacteria bacterium]|nr:ATP-binding cassette domain-containing protein [candidate division Zixibacteria bacterium]
MTESARCGEAALKAEELTRVVQTPEGEKTIVDHFSYEFLSGRVYSIIGPSGAGKSSLLRLFNRLDPITSGRVIFDGKDTRETDPTQLRRCVGYLFQEPYMFKGTVADNIRYAQPNLSDTEVVSLVEAVRLRPEQATASVDNLSGGEKQRVAIARLLATNPSVALLDEPTSSLDPGRTEAIEKMVLHIVEERGLTVIMVSHDLHQALRMGGETLLLVAGRLEEHGPAEQVVNAPRSDLGKRYKAGELV